MNSKSPHDLREEARLCRMLAAQMSLRSNAAVLLAEAKELEDKAAVLETTGRQPEAGSGLAGWVSPAPVDS